MGCRASRALRVATQPRPGEAQPRRSITDDGKAEELRDASTTSSGSSSGDGEGRLAKGESSSNSPSEVDETIEALRAKAGNAEDGGGEAELLAAGMPSPPRSALKSSCPLSGGGAHSREAAPRKVTFTDAPPEVVTFIGQAAEEAPCVLGTLRRATAVDGGDADSTYEMLLHLHSVDHPQNGSSLRPVFCVDDAYNAKRPPHCLELLCCPGKGRHYGELEEEIDLIPERPIWVCRDACGNPQIEFTDLDSERRRQILSGLGYDSFSDESQDEEEEETEDEEEQEEEEEERKVEGGPAYPPSPPPRCPPHPNPPRTAFHGHGAWRVENQEEQWPPGDPAAGNHAVATL